MQAPPFLRDTRSIGMFARFMLAGLPAFVLAVPLNWFLVTHISLPRSASYLIVLVMQMTLNFAICRRFVFRDRNTRPWLVEYSTFMAGNAVIRTFDWLAYSALVAIRPEWYLYFQLLNVALFSVLKFAFARYLFRKTEHLHETHHPDTLPERGGDPRADDP